MPPSLQLLPSNRPLQRDAKTGKTSGKAAGKGGESEDKPFNLGDWITEEAYEALKKELGEDKLKKHAGEVAKAAADELTKLMKGSGEEGLQGIVDETHLKNIGELIKDDLAKEVLDILNSDQGKALQKKLLGIVKSKPEVVIGMALVGLAIAYAKDVKLSKEKEFKLGDSLKGKVKGDLGSAQNISFKTLEASLTYTGKSFKTTLTGGHTKEGKKPGTSALLDMAAGKEGKAEMKSKTEVHIDPDKNLTFKLSPEFRMRLFGAGGALAYSETASKSWSGSAFLVIGGKKKFFKPVFTVDEEGNIVFKVDSQLLTDTYKLTSSFGYDEGKNKYSGTAGYGPAKGSGFSASLGGNYQFGSSDVPYPVWDASASAGYKSPNFGLGGKFVAGSRPHSETGKQEYYGQAEVTASAKIAGGDRHSLSLQSKYTQDIFTPGSNLTGGLQYKGTVGSTPLYLNFNMGGYLVMPEIAGAPEGEGPKPFNGSLSLVIPLGKP